MPSGKRLRPSCSCLERNTASTMRWSKFVPRALDAQALAHQRAAAVAADDVLRLEDLAAG